MSETLGRIAAALAALPQRFVSDAVDDFDDALTDSLAAATGGDFSLSGAPADLSVDVDNDGTSATITAGGSQAQWAWLEEGTEPHWQPLRRAMHPGTAGRKTWSDPVDARMRRLPREARQLFDEAMQE
jgi:hypothetical protein